MFWWQGSKREPAEYQYIQKQNEDYVKVFHLSQFSRRNKFQ